LRLGEDYAGGVMERQMVTLQNLNEHRTDFCVIPHRGEDLLPTLASAHRQRAGQGCWKFSIVPLRARHAWMSFLDTLAQQAALAIDNAELVRHAAHQPGDAFGLRATIEGWSHALDLRQGN
jgi:hypothetical protein